MTAYSILAFRRLRFGFRTKVLLAGDPFLIERAPTNPNGWQELLKEDARPDDRIISANVPGRRILFMQILQIIPALLTISASDFFPIANLQETGKAVPTYA